MNEIATLTGAVQAASADQMPHSIEAEQQLLGAILTNNDLYDRVASVIGPFTRAFGRPPPRGSRKTRSPRP